MLDRADWQAPSHPPVEGPLQDEDAPVKLGTQSNPESDILPHQIGKIGVGLLTKATLCAVMIALVAGMVAALFGS